MAESVRIQNFIINNVESPEVFQYMLDNNLVNESEFYIVQNDIPAGFRQTTVSIPAAGWTGSSQPYSQVVTINTVTPNTKIDLQPTAAQILEMQNRDISFVAENNNGVVTIYAFGWKPNADYTMPVLLTEVTAV